MKISAIEREFHGTRESASNNEREDSPSHRRWLEGDITKGLKAAVVAFSFCYRFFIIQGIVTEYLTYCFANTLLESLLFAHLRT